MLLNLYERRTGFFFHPDRILELCNVRPNLGWKDIVPNVNFFCDVPVFEAGKLADAIFTDAPSHAGDFVDLRAEMDALAFLSNCPQMNSPCNASNPTSIRVIVWQPES